MSSSRAQTRSSSSRRSARATAAAAVPSLVLPQRQVHLDFHTSPFIPDVGVEFDAEAFAATMRRAHVDSVTVFARCHHGMCYYPAKTGTVHPAIGQRDLLGEMIEALHRAGIRAPIYTTVAWDEDLARRRPEWSMLRADGIRPRAGGDHRVSHPGSWYFNEFLHPDYLDFLEAHTRELCERYEVDGLFYDIVFHPGGGHDSEAAMRFRAKHGLLANDDETFQRFASAAQEHFAARFTRLLRGLAPRATVFYNSAFDVTVDGTGGRARARHCSHIEIESLPSGFWGYYHFPRLARGAGRWGLPWIGMTGRFQKMWGDFGGIKPQPALEYECFRSQALGGGNSVGDQLPPRGTLDVAAYDLIGAVYEQCAAAEPFYAGSVDLPHLGIITANFPGRPGRETTQSDEGAILMAEECHYDVAVLDELSDLSPYALLVLPDATVITPRLREALRAFHQRGGQLILSYHAGRDAAGQFALDFLPLQFAGDVDKFPTFWRARRSFWPEFAASDRVFYAQGANLVPDRGLEVLVDRVLPYFKRNDVTFSSHFQTPPVARPDRHPAVVAGPGFVYFADPIFREYRRVGNIAARDAWRRVAARLVGPAPYGHGLPTTVSCVARQRGADLILTLLHYVPLRKSLELDVLEERMSFAGETLRLPAAAREVRVFGTGEVLPRIGPSEFALPTVKGRLLLEVPGFFAPA
jgi:hypothetical protein